MNILNKTLQKNLLSHAEAEYPNESCGLIVKQGNKKVYIPCENRADKSETENEFVISAEDYADAEDTGEILAVFHSHPDSNANPSLRDRAVCSQMGVPWIIASWPEGDIRIVVPENFPLEGRPFCHGTDLDCYGLVRDYYQQKLQVNLSRYDHDTYWWEQDEGTSFYEDYYEKEGFYKIPMSDLKRHDLIIMQIRAKKPNHAGIYLGNNQMLHHMFGKPSQRVVYGGYWAEHTVFCLRHESRRDK